MLRGFNKEANAGMKSKHTAALFNRFADKDVVMDFLKKHDITIEYYRDADDFSDLKESIDALAEKYPLLKWVQTSKGFKKLVECYEQLKQEHDAADVKGGYTKSNDKEYELFFKITHIVKHYFCWYKGYDNASCHVAENVRENDICEFCEAFDFSKDAFEAAIRDFGGNYFFFFCQARAGKFIVSPFFDGKCVLSCEDELKLWRNFADVMKTAKGEHDEIM